MSWNPITRRARTLHDDSSGHGAILIVDAIPAVGAILLGAGAAAGEDVLTIVGAVALGVGIIARGAGHHIKVDYPIYERLNALETDESSDD